MKTFTLFNYTIHALGYPSVLDQFKQWQKETLFRYIVTLNAEMMVFFNKNKQLEGYVKGASLCLPDGMGLVWAIRILFKTNIQRCTGIDLLHYLFSRSTFTFYLVGSTSKIVSLATHHIKKTYPNVQILGAHHGYLYGNDKNKVISDIQTVSPDIVLVGMGAPNQEAFILSLKDRLSTGIAIGVGGSFDVLSKQKKRAPSWVQVLGFEWLFRTIIEPKRVLRWRFIPQFLFLLLKEPRHVRG